jgi:hypothetical protein
MDDPFPRIMWQHLYGEVNINITTTKSTNKVPNNANNSRCNPQVCTRYREELYIHLLFVKMTESNTKKIK